MEEFHKEFGWFVYGLLGIGALWFFTGGAYNYTAREPYIKPLAPLNSGETYGSYYSPESLTAKERLDLPDAPGDIARSFGETIKAFFTSDDRNETPVTASASPLSGALSFDGVAGAKESAPSSEYLRVIANVRNTESVSLSGMRLDGSKVDGLALPAAADRFVLGAPAAQTPVVLPSDGRVLVSTGKSPVGASFRINACTGYLNQSASFTPELRRECPSPIDELRASGPYEEIACRSFVGNIPHCSSFSGDVPRNISETCRSFVNEKLTYNGCMAAHVNDKGFLKNEWRLFLGQNAELWDNSNDAVRLLDPQGRVIDTLDI